MDAWAKVKNREGTGTLDRAIKDENIEAIPRILNDFLPLNREFLEMAAEHFQRVAERASGKGLASHSPNRALHDKTTIGTCLTQKLRIVCVDVISFG